LLDPIGYLRIQINKIIPGTARAVVKRKNKTQPNSTAIAPEGIANIVRPNAMKDVRRANWVPVYDLWQRPDRYATKAVEARPPAKLSRPTATPSKYTSGPALARSANRIFVTA
jgi:hypothetical protein